MTTHPDLRNAHLADLAVLQIPLNPETSQREILKACGNYWQKFRRKVYCFADLKDSINSLNQQHQRDFLDHLDQSPEINADGAKASPDRMIPKLNGLKMKYCFDLSTEASKSELELFAHEALHLYRESLKATSPCPEAALLAAMTLARLAFSSTSGMRVDGTDAYLLQASFILEACRTLTQEYYPYSLLLLKVEAVLGLMSLAMKAFKQLNIKNMQWETTGHLLLTRISTLHPQAFGRSTPSEDKGIEPLRALGSALSMSDGSGESLSIQIRSGLKNGSYVNVIESLDMRSDLEHSLSREVYAYDEARIKRILNLPDIDEIRSRPCE